MSSGPAEPGYAPAVLAPPRWYVWELPSLALVEAVVASDPSVGRDPRAWVQQHHRLASSSAEVCQALALLEWQPTLSHDSVPASRHRSTPRSSGSPRLSDDAVRRAPSFHTASAGTTETACPRPFRCDCPRNPAFRGSSANGRWHRGLLQRREPAAVTAPLHAIPGCNSGRWNWTTKLGPLQRPVSCAPELQCLIPRCCFTLSRSPCSAR